MNRHCQVIPVEAFLTPENMGELIPEDTDYVIDAIDTVICKACCD